MFSFVNIVFPVKKTGSHTREWIGSEASHCPDTCSIHLALLSVHEVNCAHTHTHTHAVFSPFHARLWYGIEWPWLFTIGHKSYRFTSDGASYVLGYISGLLDHPVINSLPFVTINKWNHGYWLRLNNKQNWCFAL